MRPDTPPESTTHAPRQGRDRCDKRIRLMVEFAVYEPRGLVGSIVRTVDEILPRQAVSELREYKRAVERALPGVERLILFGSRARGQARADSDYDVAVVVRDLSDLPRVRRALSDLAYEHILNGFYIRPIPLPPDYLDTHGRRPTELAEEIIRDGAEVA